MIPRGGQDRVDAIGDGLEQTLEELPGGLAICLIHALCHCKLAGPVNTNKEIELALDCLNFRDIPSRACEHALTGGGYETSPLSTMQASPAGQWIG